MKSGIATRCVVCGAVAFSIDTPITDQTRCRQCGMVLCKMHYNEQGGTCGDGCRALERRWKVLMDDIRNMK